MTAERVSPFTHDPESAPFFAAARERRLVVRQCLDCGNGLHTPTVHCPFCGSWNTDWRESNGEATLYSWTTVMHQVHPAFPVPYTIVVIALRDKPHAHMVGMLPGAPELQAGMPMKLWFESLPDGAVLPQWKPAGQR